MSRKHFIALAEIYAAELSIVGTVAEAYTVRNLILSTADMCKRANTSFKRERFYAACGLDEAGQIPEVTLARKRRAA
jgi:hypothetical protein